MRDKSLHSSLSVCCIYQAESFRALYKAVCKLVPDVYHTAVSLHTVAALAELRVWARSMPLQHVMTQNEFCCAQRFALHAMTALMLNGSVR